MTKEERQMKEAIIEAAKEEAKEQGAAGFVVFKKTQGMAFFRKPTFPEWETMAAYKGTAEENTAYMQYVEKCMLFAIELPSGEKINADQCREREGFLFFIAGCGALVNTLGGADGAASHEVF